MKKANFKGKQVQLTVYLPAKTKEKLVKLSEKTQVPMNRIFNNAVARELGRMEKKWR